MHKKLITACLAIAAFAAFAASSASAANLTENGVTIAAGASITGHTTESVFTAGNNTVTCTYGHMSGTVTADVGGTIAGEVPAGSSEFRNDDGTDCSSNGLGPVTPTLISRLCLHIPVGTDLGTVTGCGGPVTFRLDVTALGISCAYSAPSIPAEITTGTGLVNVWEREAKLETGQSFFCPPSGKLDMEFELTTTTSQGGTPLIFS